MTTNAWVLPVTGAWSTASNWSAGVPTSSQDLLIEVNGTYEVDVSGAVSAQTLTIDDDGASVSLFTGSTLTLGGLLQLEAGSLVLQGGTLAGGTIVATNGTLQSPIFGSALVGVTTEGTLTLSGGMYNPTVDGITLLGTGGTGTGVLAVTSGTTNFGTTQIIAAGTIDLGSGGSSYTPYQPAIYVTSGSTLTLGSGVLLQTTESATSVSGSVVNDGTIDAGYHDTNSGLNSTLTMSGTLLNQGLITVAAHDAVVVTSDSMLDNAGTIQVSAGGTLELLGSFANTGSFSAAGGTILVGGQVTQPELDSLVGSGASLVLAGNARQHGRHAGGWRGTDDPEPWLGSLWILWFASFGSHS